MNHNVNEDKNRGGKGGNAVKGKSGNIELFGGQICINGHFLTRTFFSFLGIFQILYVQSISSLATAEVFNVNKSFLPVLQ